MTLNERRRQNISLGCPATGWDMIGKNSNISGFSYSGELFAFIGIGDAKSYLLRTISVAETSTFSPYTDLSSGSNANGVKTSCVQLNGEQLNSQPSNFSLLEFQDLDLIYGNLTVLETLVFSAELRLHDPTNRSELAALRLLAEMGLNEMEDLRTSELCQWQRRVILFASEVIAGRDILFVDQPTADLDAPSALAMVTALKRAARGDRLVAITVSSLTFREYAVIDRIQLLSTNGYIYFGAGSSALTYFEALQRTPFAGESISDFLLDLVDDEFMPGFYKDMQKLERAAQRIGSSQFQAPPMRREPPEDPKAVVAASSERPVAVRAVSWGGGLQQTVRAGLRWVAGVRRGCRRASRTVQWLAECECLESPEEDCLQLRPPATLQQLGLCFWRALLVRWRNRRRLLAVFLLSGCLLPLLSLTIFFPLLSGEEEEDRIRSRLLFFSLFPFLSALLSTLWSDDAADLFDRRVFTFERHRRYYVEPAVFPLSQWLAEVLVVQLPPTAFACIVTYPAVSCHFSWTGFMRFLYIFTLIILTSSSLEKVIYATKNALWGPKAINASILHALTLSLFLPFAGPLLNNELVRPASFGFLVQQTSFFHWGCYLLFLNEFDSLEWLDLNHVKEIHHNVSDNVRFDRYDADYLYERFRVQPLDPLRAQQYLWIQIVVYLLLYHILYLVLKH